MYMLLDTQWDSCCTGTELCYIIIMFYYQAQVWNSRQEKANLLSNKRI